MNINRLLHRLETERMRIATEAMEQPAGGDTFAHGRTVGMYHGIVLARQIVDELLNEDRRREI